MKALDDGRGFETKHLVLWDIDGTLVDTAGLGREAFVEAFDAVFGRAVRGLTSMNGRTDREIALELFVVNGVEQPERHLDGFCGALAEALAGKAELIRARGRAYPGARRTLERLAAEPGIVQSVLTGNIEPNAELKLASFYLHEHLDLEVGGYGSDHSVRTELVSAARRKAERKHGLRFTPSETVVIGDTPLDVAAALAAGARPFGVASGPFRVEELGAAGAEAVFEDLRDSELVARAITEGRSDD